MICNLREFVLTHIILVLGTSEVGLGAATLVPLPGLQVIAGIASDCRASSGRPLFVCRHYTRRPFALSWTSYVVENLLYALGWTKATSMATQGGPKWTRMTKSCPK